MRRGDAAASGGMAAIQIAPIAARAGVAAGTVYRYFPGKIELVGALVESVSEREIEAVRRAADAAPGPLSALAAAIATFGARALRNRRLTWAVIAEPVDTDTDAVRQQLSHGACRRDRDAHPRRDRRRPSAGAGRGTGRAGAARRAARRPDRPARAREASTIRPARARRCRR